MAEKIKVNGSETGIFESRKSELEWFENSKAGVKGLLDSGVTKIPPIFHCLDKDHESINASAESELSSNIPIINLHGGDFDSDSGKEEKVVDEIRSACEKWGFFQVVNHGIPIRVMEEMIEGIRGFHEQDSEYKKEFYSRDYDRKKVTYFSNFDLFQAKFANWRDTLACYMAPFPPPPQDLPLVCREIMVEYSKEVKKLGLRLLKLISKALGLSPWHLEDMGCGEGLLILGHYYPPCPQPHLTWGISDHTDATFITILLQHQIAGFQVLHQNQWLNVPPLHGALLINLGDFLQLITNDRFKSVNHRVIAQKDIGPRVSVASFFRPSVDMSSSSSSSSNSKVVYGPIKELLSQENPPLYKQVDPAHFLNIYFSKGLDGTSPLSFFRLET